MSDARQWWRWHSTYVFAALALLPSVWLASPELRAMLPASVVAMIEPPLAVLGFLLRIRQQASLLPKPPDDAGQSAAP
ncbi:hypothetical protein RHOFW510R12_01565 [Rhodanobacter sp. FW510-R12]|nr:hypothetical protein RHOFW104R8_13275 [Rhodanobacter sp. FW104-R8]KZC28531.1 hypothetical protein RhoFW510T8_10515 [Rhodanobacter sp. FW510-T8]KZC32366.1 hypothetical protein RhoFW510R10_13110 [Rhodanobacter sp. FW510-R10]